METVIFTVTAGKATVSAGRRDDDFADRLNSRYTPLILIVFTIMVSLNQLVRDPITCWAPVHFTDGHTKYANSYCWINNTYYLPFEDNIPHEGDWRQILRYYQYIQFVLLGQAACFYLPTLIWRAFNSKAGVDADNILRTALGIPDIKKAEKKENTIRYVSGMIDRFLESRKSDDGNHCQCDPKHVLSGLLCRCCGRRVGNYLVILYMFQKLLFLTNIVLQFVCLGLLFGEQFWIYGAKMVADPIPDDQWTARGFIAFPRVTLCDFHVRRLGNVHRYTLQCVLPLNLFIEKMYIVIWFWMIFVMAVTVFYFVIWSIRFIRRKERSNFVTNHLRSGHRLDTIEAQACTDNFVYAYLRQDGHFLLRLIATNTNHISTTDIVGGVWDFWCEKTGRTFDSPTPALTDDTTVSDDKPLIRKPHNHTGLKWRPRRKKKHPEDDEPKKSDLSRAPTLYIRGSDTLDSRRPRKGYLDDSDTPNGNSEDKTPSSIDDSTPTKPQSLDDNEAYPMKDVPPIETIIDDVPPVDTDQTGLYPTIPGTTPIPSAPPVATWRPPSAPLADIEDTAV